MPDILEIIRINNNYNKRYLNMLFLNYRKIKDVGGRAEGNKKNHVSRGIKVKKLHLIFLCKQEENGGK